MIVFIIFLLVFALEGVRGRIKATKVLKHSVIALGLSLLVLVLGELVAYLCALSVGAAFKPFGITAGISFDNAAMIVSVAVMFLAMVTVYVLNRRKTLLKVAGSMRASATFNAASGYACNALYGTLALMFVLSAALVFTLGENLMFLIPLVCATSALLLWRVTSWKGWILLGIMVILLHAFSFLYALAMALTIGAFGAVAMLAFLDLMVIIPMADIYAFIRKK